MQTLGPQDRVLADEHKIAALDKLVAIYADIDNSEAWKDFMARLLAMRNDIAAQLLSGTVDKFGHDNADAKRAVLVYLDRALTFVPAIRAQWLEFHKKHEEMRRKNDEFKSRGLHLGDF